MSTATSIEWTEATWNPTTGCDRISPGCDRCYAMTMARRLKAMGSAKYQNDGDPRTSGPGFAVTMHQESVLDPIVKWPRKSQMVFLDSMSDVFHARVAADFQGKIFATMALTPQHSYITFCRDSPCCTTLCCSTPTRCGAAAASQTGCSPARQEARHELAGGASPGFRHSRGCGRDVVVWDVWCEDSFDGIWHLDGICGDIPTPYLVREHCLKCELVRVSPWCSECVLAYRHEQEQQFNNGEDRYLWCYACGQFSLDWQAVDASQEAGHPNQDRAN
ncbi:hypothetical protein CKJ66_26800 [Mycobacterium avium]|uniref:DUF5131 family protein n=1 Tax=Mycobacterium avium TaxID=1764 RepID=A0A2A2ZBK9_MYCAV|nr:hypothetical protein CKJ66_26800 [Mycobacterium avium]